MNDILLKLLDRSLDLALAAVFAWVGTIVRRLMKDLGYYFDMVRASTAISQDQENRLRRLEGKPELSAEQWRDLVKTHMKGGRS